MKIKVFISADGNFKSLDEFTDHVNQYIATCKNPQVQTNYQAFGTVMPDPKASALTRGGAQQFVLNVTQIVQITVISE